MEEDQSFYATLYIKQKKRINETENKIYKMNPDISVFSLATPLLAPMIESGFHNESIKQKMLSYS